MVKRFLLLIGFTKKEVDNQDLIDRITHTTYLDKASPQVLGWISIMIGILEFILKNWLKGLDEWQS